MNFSQGSSRWVSHRLFLKEKKNEREGVEKERSEEEEIGSIEVGEAKRDMDPSW